MALRWRARQGKRCPLQLGQRCAWRRDMIDDRAAIVPESEGVSVCGTGMHESAASSRADLTQRVHARCSVGQVTCVRRSCSGQRSRRAKARSRPAARAIPAPATACAATGTAAQTTSPSIDVVVTTGAEPPSPSRLRLVSSAINRFINFHFQV